MSVYSHAVFYLFAFWWQPLQLLTWYQCTTISRATWILGTLGFPLIATFNWMVTIYVPTPDHGCLTSVEPRWQGATIHGLITEVKQPWARSTLGWVTIQDTVLVAKDVIVTCHVPLWPMSYEHTRGSQSAPQLVKRPGCVLSCLCDWCT